MTETQRFVFTLNKMTYRKKENFVCRKIAGETVLVPLRGNLAELQKLFVLDGIGGYLWDRIDGKTPVEELCRDVISHYDVDKQQADADVKEFFSRLLAAGIVLEVEP